MGVDQYIYETDTLRDQRSIPFALSQAPCVKVFYLNRFRDEEMKGYYGGTPVKDEGTRHNKDCKFLESNQPLVRSDRRAPFAPCAP